MPEPMLVSEAEVAALQEKVETLQKQYDIEIAANSEKKSDQLDPFRAMVSDIGSMLNRSFAYSGGGSELANPYAKIMVDDESALAEAGLKSSDYQRYMTISKSDTISRLERDLEEAKAELRVLAKALAKSTPVTPPVLSPGQVANDGPIAMTVADEGPARPRISVRASKPVEAVAPVAEGPKIGPVQLPALPKVSVPKFLYPPCPPCPSARSEYILSRSLRLTVF